ncbi:protein GOLM2 isoform X1 [Lethenteron reissneri]|uniref:protein GOLM2 isoform X1 n=1 Tax=Lethenteron reissneri TaxID=7753 RepID=UPI002AB6B676|nr:protein GOLM2 isoform X1 [Lethenteron reissneri]
MMGFGGTRRGGRAPPLVLAALLVVSTVLAFNYWIVSGRNNHLTEELEQLGMEKHRLEAAKVRVEKRTAELSGQVENHRVEVQSKKDELMQAGSLLRDKERELHQCMGEKSLMARNISDTQVSFKKIQGEFVELQREYIRLQGEMDAYKRNSSSLQQRLEYNSFQCNQQLTSLKDQYEEKLEALKKENSKLKAEAVEKKERDIPPKAPEKEKVNAAKPEQNVGEKVKVEKLETNDIPAEQANVSPDGEQGKLEKKEGDAGMPDIVEETENKKKPDDDEQKAVVEEPDKKKEDTVNDGKVVKVTSPKQNKPPRVTESKKAPKVVIGNPGPAPKGGKTTVVMMVPPKEEDKIEQGLEQVEKADEAEDHEPGKPGKSGRLSRESVAGAAGAPARSGPSQADPAQASRADYEGDGGNVGEYEADKQAELAYNEEEDGDGGEDDNQGERGWQPRAGKPKDDEDGAMGADRNPGYANRPDAPADNDF